MCIRISWCSFSLTLPKGGTCPASDIAASTGQSLVFLNQGPSEAEAADRSPDIDEVDEDL